jgi:hypothetical protein
MVGESHGSRVLHFRSSLKENSMPKTPVKKKSPAKKKHVPARKPVAKKEEQAATKAPVAKKAASPKEKEPAEQKQFMITRKENLLKLLDEAPTDALKELHNQVLGEDWKHGVAELGDKLREIMIKRKFDHDV